MSVLDTRCAGGLPASVKEWYSLDGIDRIMEKATCNSPLALADLGQPVDRLDGQKLLLLMYENQGVCRWAVPLNGADDPPVLVSFDDWEAPESWQPYAESFSAFAQTVLGDEREGLVLKGVDVELRDQDLEFLRRTFTAGHRTYNWPEAVNYRFARDDQYLLLWQGDRQTDWHLRADSVNSLRKLALEVWNLGQLSKSLYETCSVGAELLAELRASSTVTISGD